MVDRPRLIRLCRRACVPLCLRSRALPAGALSQRENDHRDKDQMEDDAGDRVRKGPREECGERETGALQARENIAGKAPDGAAAQHGEDEAEPDSPLFLWQQMAQQAQAQAGGPQPGQAGGSDKGEGPIEADYVVVDDKK